MFSKSRIPNKAQSTATGNPGSRGRKENDEQLVQYLKVLSGNDPKTIVSLAELNALQNSHRLFHSVVPGLIEKLMRVPLDVALQTAMKYAQEEDVQDPATHQQFPFAAGYAAAVQFFLSLFEPRPSGTYWITVKDLLNPDKQRIRGLLWTLTEVAGIAVEHEADLITVHEDVMAEVDMKSRLWPREDEIYQREQALNAEEENNVQACEKARAQLKEFEKDSTNMEDKYKDAVELANKTADYRDRINAKLVTSQAKHEKLVAQLKDLEDELIENPEEFVKSIDAVRLEVRTVEEQFQMKYAEFGEHVKKNKDLALILEEVKKFHEKLSKSKKLEFAAVTNGEKELRQLSHLQGDLKDEVRKRETTHNRSVSRIAAARQNLADISNRARSERSAQERQEKEIEKKTKSVSTKRKEIDAECSPLQEMLNSLNTRFEERRAQSFAIGEEATNHMIADMESECELLKNADMEQEASVAQQKKVLVDRIEEHMGRPFNQPPATLAETMPSSVRKIYRELRNTKMLHERNGKFVRTHKERNP